MSFLQEELDQCVQWVNLHLDNEESIQKVEQLQDGTKLIEIVEKLSGKKAPRYFPNGQTVFQIQENLNILLGLVKSCYGNDVMFDVTELSRGNIQQFLSLVFFIAKKSNTRIEKKRKFISNKTSISSVFESKFQKGLEPNTNTHNNSDKPLQELIPSQNEIKPTSSDNLDNQITLNELPLNEIQIDIIVSQMFCTLNKNELITKDLREKRINKLEKEKLSKICEEVEIQDVLEFKKLNISLDYEKGINMTEHNQINTPQIENQIDDYDKDVHKDNPLVEKEVLNDSTAQTNTLTLEEKLNKDNKQEINVIPFSQPLTETTTIDTSYKTEAIQEDSTKESNKFTPTESLTSSSEDITSQPEDINDNDLITYQEKENQQEGQQKLEPIPLECLEPNQQEIKNEKINEELDPSQNHYELTQKEIEKEKEESAQTQVEIETDKPKEEEPEKEEKEDGLIEEERKQLTQQEQEESTKEELEQTQVELENEKQKEDRITQEEEPIQQEIENERLKEENTITQKDPGVIQEKTKPNQENTEIENTKPTEEIELTQQEESQESKTTEEPIPIQTEIENEKAKEKTEEKRWNEKEYDINAVKEIQRRISGHLSRISSYSTMRLLTQRKNIVKELISTEEIYINRLRQFLDYYLKAAIELLPNDKLLKKCKEDIIVILGYNNMIYTNLTDLQKKGYYYGQGIGSVFQKLAHFLKTYCSYVNSTDAITEHENKLRKSNKQFESMINNIRKTHKMESFNSYVILPIQRIPRYRLLLKELMKTVPQQHNEYKELYDSLQRITEVGIIVNENKRKMENQHITVQLLSKFKYPQGTNPIELKGSTTFVKFGVLTLYDPETKPKNRNVNVFLFNDNLVIAKILTTGTLHKGELIPETLEPILESKKQLNVELVIPFERFTVVDWVDIEGSPAFGLITDSGETLRFSCSNKETKMNWCTELDTQISQTQEQTLVAITRSNPELISQYKQSISINDKEHLKKIVWQGDVGDNDQYLILTGNYLVLFNTVMDAYKKTSPISLYLTQCLSVIFEPPTSFSIINYCDDNKVKTTFKTTSTAAALLWVFYIRQSFIKQHGFDKTKPEIFKEEEVTFQLNSRDIIYGLIQNKYNKKCADCRTTPIHYVDMDFGCFLCLKCGMVHKNFSKKLGICKIEDIQKHSIKDIQNLISLGNAFGNIERIESCEDTSEEKTNLGDKNQYLLKKYGIEGYVHKGLVADSQRKSHVLKLDETSEKEEIDSDSQKSSVTNLEQTDSPDNDRKSKKKKSGEKKEKKANISDKKRKRSIF
ncbi:hyaluronan mediated motility receptor, putative [Entamoeba dispar SAW760]|uniref:Hyaluronan mediated motility receptor, putative n=1 Tax=Entamoeba dispar (strain ATCC PRA-260 / SAW760) TaxID=370354 RepID=B0E7K7_ENTDS|nr:hyaluronan mediated motility receptor, putative [Entamoeba dispar SAW760]EDR29477.1 hyaluronan mediated motility receptor, putative [Entamoeba dispar SAW760]|eukprot:EDR29477.1 hyaluronan mediated motility receptor, putative [Entamoeba dispar SAW760]